MNHEQMKGEVMAFIDGESRGERRSAAEAHLAECAECRALAGAWKESSALLKVERRGASERFVAAVMSRIGASEEQPSGWFSGAFSRWLAPVAAGVAFAGYIALIVIPAPEAVSGTDAVLYSEVEDQMPATWLASSTAPQDNVVDTVSEDI